MRGSPATMTSYWFQHEGLKIAGLLGVFDIQGDRVKLNSALPNYINDYTFVTHTQLFSENRRKIPESQTLSTSHKGVEIAFIVHSTYYPYLHLVKI